MTNKVKWTPNFCNLRRFTLPSNIWFFYRWLSVGWARARLTHTRYTLNQRSTNTFYTIFARSTHTRNKKPLNLIAFSYHARNVLLSIIGAKQFQPGCRPEVSRPNVAKINLRNYRFGHGSRKPELDAINPNALRWLIPKITFREFGLARYSTLT